VDAVGNVIERACLADELRIPIRHYLAALVMDRQSQPFGPCTDDGEQGRWRGVGHLVAEGAAGGDNSHQPKEQRAAHSSLLTVPEIMSAACWRGWNLHPANPNGVAVESTIGCATDRPFHDEISLTG
jgi:hypothetical protein